MAAVDTCAIAWLDQEARSPSPEPCADSKIRLGVLAVYTLSFFFRRSPGTRSRDSRKGWFPV
jgi:hypothetical protein